MSRLHVMGKGKQFLLAPLLLALMLTGLAVVPAGAAKAVAPSCKPTMTVEVRATGVSGPHALPCNWDKKGGWAFTFGAFDIPGLTIKRSRLAEASPEFTLVTDGLKEQFGTTLRVGYTATHEGRSSSGTLIIRVREKPVCRDRSATVRLRVDVDVACYWADEYSISRAPDHGKASISPAGRITYLADGGYSGADEVRYSAANEAGRTTATVSLQVKADPGRTVAIGDSYTAGFAYYADGAEMSIARLGSCKPKGDSAKGNDACSSNSDNRDAGEGSPNFSRDFGFANQVSWAAQFAKTLGVGEDDYRNFGITGSTAEDWKDNLHGLVDRVVREDPDTVIMTLGGNPTLSKILFGDYVWKECFGRYYECTKKMIEKVGTPGQLRSVYTELLRRTTANILVMTYPKVTPAITLGPTRWDLADARQALNDVIRDAVNDIRRETPKGEGWRINYQDVDSFKVGSPPGDYASVLCPASALKNVDGPSNQAAIAQAELSLIPPFCFGTPWLTSGDTGIHPNEKGYGQIKDQAVARYRDWNSRTTRTWLSPRKSLVRARAGTVVRLPFAREARRARTDVVARLAPAVGTRRLPGTDRRVLRARADLTPRAADRGPQRGSVQLRIPRSLDSGWYSTRLRSEAREAWVAVRVRR